MAFSIIYYRSPGLYRRRGRCQWQSALRTALPALRHHTVGRASRNRLQLHGPARSLAAVGLIDYKARWYETGLGKLSQPDTTIPNLADPQALNRYAYTINNPIRFSDPSGHRLCNNMTVVLPRQFQIGGFHHLTPSAKLAHQRRRHKRRSVVWRNT